MRPLNRSVGRNLSSQKKTEKKNKNKYLKLRTQVFAKRTKKRRFMKDEDKRSPEVSPVDKIVNGKNLVPDCKTLAIARVKTASIDEVFLPLINE